MLGSAKGGRGVFSVYAYFSTYSLRLCPLPKTDEHWRRPKVTKQGREQGGEEESEIMSHDRSNCTNVGKEFPHDFKRK